MLVIDVYIFLQFGYTPLHEACQNGHYQVVEALMKAGANIEAVNKVNFNVLLQYCVVYLSECIKCSEMR